MSDLNSLIRLQELDSQLDGVAHLLRSLPEQVTLDAKHEEIAGVDAESRGIDDQAATLETEQRRLEREIAAIGEKLKDANDRLYAVTSSREHDAVKEEIAGAEQTQDELETGVLEIMEQLGELDEQRAALRTQRDALDAEAVTMTAVVAERQTELAGDSESLVAERAEIDAALPDAVVSEYESLRADFAGTPVARLVGTNCEGCPMAMPAVEMDRIRRSDDPVNHCNECGRMVIH